jgi:hypothetical protein
MPEDVGNVVMYLLFILGPLTGASVCIVALVELRALRAVKALHWAKDELRIKRLERAKNQFRSRAILGAIGFFFSTALVLGLVGPGYLWDQQQGPVYSPKNVIINDITNIAANAHQYRIRPKSMGGGQGSYLGFEIPQKMRAYPEHNKNYKFQLLAVYSDSIIIEGNVVANQSMDCKVLARIDSTGRLGEWLYSGEFK